MQTFLPYPDFEASAAALDYRRLGKQRVEAFQILKALRGESKGWINHPCIKMWRGHETALAAYMNTMIREWIRRGYKNTMKIEDLSEYNMPSWFGLEAFHLSHRCNLARKSEYYRNLWPDVDVTMPYLWPAA
jgi:hypothetical protein